MKIAITGADGFLGWHTRAGLRARGDSEVVAIDRALAARPSDLAAALDGADAVIHCAGVNRAEPPEEVVQGNILAAEQLTESLSRAKVRPLVLYANSIHSGEQSPFGEGKETAAGHLKAWGDRAGAPVADIRLPNLFGEHGRPGYNSFVATFCHALATGAEPVIKDDRVVPLLHVQDAVDVMVDLVDGTAGGVFHPEGNPSSVTDVLAKLRGFAELYRSGDVPDIANRFDRALFNTFRSFCFPARFPIHPRRHADNRGSLFECVRARGGEAQVFCSETNPGFTRGDHFHRRKVERFVVLSGSARISLRRVLTDEIVDFEVSGDHTALVDMPTLWAHAITNTGPSELVTLFWADEVLDPNHTDTYPEKVRADVSSA
ncbi:MAG: NAD-dependent epimerase/dehydratase family protein [Candidatus Dormibacteria bacterium]